jgi:inosine-uridine nucleoside N-ribohydrolase
MPKFTPHPCPQAVHNADHDPGRDDLTAALWALHDACTLVWITAGESRQITPEQRDAMQSLMHHTGTQAAQNAKVFHEIQHFNAEAVMA